jgi:hypothetical protein
MAGIGRNIAGLFTMTKFIYMSLYLEFCHDKQNSHGSTTTPQPQCLSKTECYQLGSSEKVQEKNATAPNTSSSTSYTE